MRRPLFVLLVPVALTVASCLGPTEIVVTISTNACPALAHTDIYVDGNQVGLAQTPACDPNNPLAKVELGNITILPTHGIDSTIHIALVGAVGGACSSPETTEHGCIIARRSLSFIPHTRLDLPIFLDNACANHSCPPTDTCEVDDKVGAHCVPAGCGSADTEPCVEDAGGAVDAGPIGDVVTDVAPSCPSIFPTPNAPTLAWSFEQTTTDGRLHDDQDVITPAPSLAGPITAVPPIFCGTYLALAKGTQTLVPNGSPYLGYFKDPSFAFGFAFMAAGDGPIFDASYSSQFGAFHIAIVGGFLVLSFDAPGQSNPIYASPKNVTDQQWHRFGFEVATVGVAEAGATSSLVTIYDDGNVAGPFKTTTPYSPGSIVAFTAGPIAGIDQVAFYAK